MDDAYDKHTMDKELQQNKLLTPNCFFFLSLMRKKFNKEKRKYNL